MIQELTIPTSVENIGYCAFAGQKVRRLMLPEGLRCVEPLAFMTEMDDDAEMELYIGIAAGAAITLITGQVTALELMGNMGGGVSGMFETILVTLLVAISTCATLGYAISAFDIIPLLF